MAKESRSASRGNAPALQQTAVPAQPRESISAKFANDVIAGFAVSIGAPQVTDYQLRLIQNYFIGIDRALAEAESKRSREDRPPVWWTNVNMEALVVDVVDCARLGLDMSQENHLYAIPYFNEKTRRYDVTLMTGYVGIEYVAMKYAADPPVNVTLQLVYENDVFKPIMRDAAIKVEAYRFEIPNPFDRGSLIGGFGYIEYKDARKNRLVTLSKAQMDKRKPERRSGNFWGKWDDEMYLKTLARHVYSPKYIPRDPMKIDDAYQHRKLREAQIAALEAETAVETGANREVIDVTPDVPGLSASSQDRTAAAPGLPESRSVPLSTPVDTGTGELLDVSPAAPNGGASPVHVASMSAVSDPAVQPAVAESEEDPGF